MTEAGGLPVSNERTARTQTHRAMRPLSFAVEGHRGETQFVKAYGATSSCTDNYPSRETMRAFALSEAAAKNHLLSDATATTKNGSRERHGSCSARMLALRSLLQQERQRVAATNTLREIQSRAVSPPPVLSEQSCEPNKAGNGCAALWKAQSRNGGSKQNEQDGSLRLSRPSNSSRGGVESSGARSAAQAVSGATRDTQRTFDMRASRMWPKATEPICLAALGHSRPTAGLAPGPRETHPDNFGEGEFQ